MTFGPVSLRTIRSLAAAGELFMNDYVKCGNNGDWRPAGSVSELSDVARMELPEEVGTHTGGWRSTANKPCTTRAIGFEQTMRSISVESC